jgi:FkbH-like protein
VIILYGQVWKDTRRHKNNNRHKYFGIYLKKHEEGFLIVILSKNNEEDVWNIFQNHPDMLLKESHIISSRINWNEKHLNIKEIATELNLSLNNFIFIDDNVMECHTMIVGNPEVLTLQLPENESHIAGFFNSIISLDKFDITYEDKLRNEMYLSEKERNKYAEEGKDQNIDFLSKLNLQLYFNEIVESSLKRMVQLSKRTNQFNMNGVILEDSDLRNMMARGYKGYSITLKDLFGDYGIVGCLILKEDQEDLTIQISS